MDFKLSQECGGHFAGLPQLHPPGEGALSRNSALGGRRCNVLGSYEDVEPGTAGDEGRNIVMIARRPSRANAGMTTPITALRPGCYLRPSTVARHRAWEASRSQARARSSD